MTETNIACAEAYYKALNDRDLLEMERYLHSDVRFVGPLASFTGKEGVLEAAKRLIPLLKSITVRARFGLKDQVMLAYDWDFLPPIGLLRAAVLMAFKDNLISRIELFYDARPFEQKEIFS